MTALVKLILALLAVIVLCLLFAGSVGYSDPLYYTYSYTPWVPWTRRLVPVARSWRRCLRPPSRMTGRSTIARPHRPLRR